MNFDALLHFLNFTFRFFYIPFLAIAMFAVLPLAIFISLALIRLFRTRVGRGMRSRAANVVDAATGQAARPSPPTLPRGELEIEQMHGDGKLERAASRTALLADARRHGNRVAAIYAGAACSFPFILAAVTMALMNKGYLANGLLVSSMLYGVYVLLHASPAVLAPTVVLKKQPRYLLLSLLILAFLYGTFDVSVQSDGLLGMARIILAFVPIAILIAPIVLSYQPKILVIAAFSLVAVLWLPLLVQPLHYDTGGMTRLSLYFVPVPAAIVLLFNIRRLRAVGPIIYAATAIFFFAYVSSTALTASAEVALGESRFDREDLNQMPIDEALARFSKEKYQEISLLHEEEQVQAWIEY